MYCEQCKKRPATVHVTKVMNNQKTEQHLCDECAREQQNQLGLAFESNFPIHKFLAGLLGYETPSDNAVNLSFNQPRKCETCGLTYEQIGQMGRLGCSQCYASFAERLEPLLRRIHGSGRHTGKVPQRTGGAIRLEKEIQKLRSSLQQLIQREEFEKAAEVRDRIRQLENRLG